MTSRCEEEKNTKEYDLFDYLNNFFEQFSILQSITVVTYLLRLTLGKRLKNRRNNQQRNDTLQYFCKRAYDHMKDSIASHTM